MVRVTNYLNLLTKVLGLGARPQRLAGGKATMSLGMWLEQGILANCVRKRSNATKKGKEGQGKKRKQKEGGALKRDELLALQLLGCYRKKSEGHWEKG